MMMTMKKLQLFFVGLASAAVLFSAAPALAQSTNFSATSKQESCQALKDISPDGGTCNNPAGRGVTGLMKLAIQMVSIVAGIIAVIMIIVSGFKYVTSQGDSNSISSAKQSLIYAIVGLVIVAFAQFIVRFVLTESIQA